MSAGYLELFIEQGEDFNVYITLDALNGEAYSIANSSVKADIRKSHWSANTTCSFGAEITNPELGIINLSLPANTTQNLSYGRYVYDIFLTKYNVNTSSNTRSKVLEGVIFIDPSSTRI